MTRPQSGSAQSKYRPRFIYCSLVLTIGLPLARIQASPGAFYTGKGVSSYNCVASPMQEQQQTRQLEPGKPIERELTGGQSHSYQIPLTAGQYVKLMVDEYGIDVKVRLSGPDGKQITEVNSESRTRGQETVSWVAEEAGSYRVDVPAKYKNAAAGRYQIQVVEVRIATGDDRALHEARKLNTEFGRLYLAGKYDEARPLGERVLEIREKVLGLDHPDVAQSVNNLALLYHLKGDYAKSEQLYEHTLTTREKVLGPEHPDVAASLNNLAKLYNDRGEYAKAEMFYGRALTVGEKALGPEHPDVAAFLSNLANLYCDRGDFAKAEPLYRRALTILEKALGPEHPYAVNALHNLAILYKTMGDYARAEPLFVRTLDLGKKVLGPEHPYLAGTLINLANLYYDRGDYDKAEPLYKSALTIKEKALGPDHPDVARALDSLAEIYYEKGEYAKAEPLLDRALNIREKALGPEHPEIAFGLNNLANLYRARGEYAKAEPFYGRAMAIRERALGPDHPDIAVSLGDLANLYRERGEYAKAEPLYARALNIRERALGPEHPLFAESLNDLAELYAAKGDYAQAVAVLSRANAIDERNLENNLAIGSERQKLVYLDLFSKRTNFTLSLQSQAAPKDPQALELAFTTLLRRKARGLDVMTDTIATLRRHATPEDQKLFNKLAQARSQLATLTLKGPGTAKPDIHRARVTRLELEVDELEGKLNSRSAEFRKQVRPITLSAVQTALPVDGALVEFTYFTPRELQTGKTRPPRYLAYLLPAQGQPKWVDLGEAAIIDHTIDAWRKALRDPTRNDVKRLARTVDDRVMRPIRSLLSEIPGGPRHLLVAPDGSLNLIPFAALVDEKNRYLIERYSISYLTSGRDLLRLQTSAPSHDAPLIIANPDFGKLSTVAMQGERNPEKSSARNQSRSQSGLVQVFFQPLPGTKDEAMAIKALLPKASVLQREEATETALKQARGPQILHIATHGFFLDYREAPPAENNPLLIVSSKPSENTGLASAPSRIVSPKSSENTGLTSTSYTVQIESTPEFETAQEAVKRLMAQGVDAYIIKSRVKGKGAFFRVRTGNFPTQAEAQKYGANLQQKGVADQFFVAQRNPPQEDLIEPAPTIAVEKAKPADPTPAPTIAVEKTKPADPTPAQQVDSQQRKPGHDPKRPAPVITTTPPADSQPAPERPSDLRLSMFVAQVKDPLLRSGLALAGANEGKSGDDDGVLTALEAAYLDLSGTKLVVLSACDTGVGEVKNGEGVQGLRRALILAGSESQVMSLWPVLDETTKDLMIPYYQALQKGAGRNEGLRQVQLQMLRGRSELRHPFYWAAFIQSGEWANLNDRR